MAKSIKTTQGKPKLTHEGRMYTQDKKSSDGSTQFWRCHYKTVCKARLHTDVASGEVVKVVGIHAEPTDAAAGQVATKVCAVRDRALSTQERPSQLVSALSEGLSVAAKGALPCPDTVKRMLNRQRAQHHRPPANPPGRELIVIPDTYALYQPELGLTESFILGDTGFGDRDRIIIFGRESVRDWVHLVDYAFADGTFSLAPLMFEQVFLILGNRGGYAIPICYALLPNKSEETYGRFLNLLVGAFPTFRPAAIGMDFEKAVINAVGQHFPQAERFGCLFHLVKNMTRQLSAHGLIGRYKEDPQFALYARMVPALAFVRPDMLNEALGDLLDALPVELRPLYDYFERYYVGRILMVRANGDIIREIPMFDVSLWSVYERTLRGEPRTNNFAEAAHRRLQTEIGCSNPTLWKFIDGLRKVQHNRDADLERFNAGRLPPPKLRKYLRSDANLLHLVQTIDERTPIDFLRGVAHNFLME